MRVLFNTSLNDPFFEDAKGNKVGTIYAKGQIYDLPDKKATQLIKEYICCEAPPVAVKAPDAPPKNKAIPTPPVKKRGLGLILDDPPKKRGPGRPPKVKT